MALAGCITAVITPMTARADLDKEGLWRLLEYQKDGGVDGIVAVGTTGESPTLTPAERISVVRRCREWVADAIPVIAGTGSNSTAEALRATREAADAGATHALLVDPYYNAPSSLEMRREYYEPIAREFPEMEFVPYVVPARTGTRLEPPDLALLREACPNIGAVKDATGNEPYARDVRRLLGSSFSILSGDDVRTESLMAAVDVRAQGVISVLSNVFPHTLAACVRALRAGDPFAGPLDRRLRALRPLLSLVTVETVQQTTKGPARVRARNPVPVKAIMSILGMPSGPCRPPLGRLTGNALTTVLDALRTSHRDCPELFDEVAATFDVAIEERLRDRHRWEGLAYAD